MNRIMHRLHGKLRFVIFFILTFASVTASGDDKPVVALLDFTCSGLGQNDGLLVVDLLNLDLLQTDSCHVIGRLERNRLLSGFEVSSSERSFQKEYKEAGDRLFADFIAAGGIVKSDNTLVMTVHLFDVTFSKLIQTDNYTFASFTELIDSCRSVSGNILEKIEKAIHPDNPGTRILDSLSPIPFKERILFLLPKGSLDTETAGLKELLNLVLSGLIPSRRFIPFVSEVDYRNDANDDDVVRLLIRNRGCHYAAIIRREKNGVDFIVMDAEMKRMRAIPISVPFDAKTKSMSIIKEIEEKLPLLPQSVLAAELKDNILVEQKLDELLFSERILSKRWNIALYSRLFKSVFLDTYIPALSILSFETDAFWYYADTVGIGFGYGYSYNYPGTWSPSCNIIPFIHEHEFRIVPFAFRTGGVFSFSLNVIASLNLHNTVDVNGYKFNASDNKELMILYTKLGLNIGIVYNFNESLGIYWNGLFFNYAIPLLIWDTSSIPAYNPPNGSFSLDIGGPGIIYRF
jgi:hypothetical protein